MTDIAPAWLLAIVFCFCRLGACLMAMPGVASARVMVRFRLALALALAILLGPLIEHQVPLALARHGAATLPKLVLSELAIGASIGMASRLFVAAMHFVGNFVAGQLGLMASSGPAVDDYEPSPPPTDLLIAAGLLLLLQSDLHLLVVGGLLQSFGELPLTDLFDAEVALSRLSDHATTAFHVALKVAGPILVVAFVINLAIGAMNRMIPWLPMQFLGAPVLLLVGILALAVSSDGLLQQFVKATILELSGP